MDFKLKSLKDSQLNGQSSFSKIGEESGFKHDYDVVISP